MEPHLINLTTDDAKADTGEKKDDEWTDEQTVFILDKYYECLPEVGPMKQFRLKKDMWVKIAAEVNTQYSTNRTGTQIENRYKTIMKRKKNAVDNNRTSGMKRIKIAYEQEINKISSIDDSIEPEILQDQSNISKKVVGTSKTEIKRMKSGKDTFLEYFKKFNEDRKLEREKYHKEKEENKNKRHKEKLELLKEFFNKR